LLDYFILSTVNCLTDRHDLAASIYAAFAGFYNIVSSCFLCYVIFLLTAMAKTR